MNDSLQLFLIFFQFSTLTIMTFFQQDNLNIFKLFKISFKGILDVSDECDNHMILELIQQDILVKIYSYIRSIIYKYFFKIFG